MMNLVVVGKFGDQCKSSADVIIILVVDVVNLVFKQLSLSSSSPYSTHHAPFIMKIIEALL